MGLRKEPKYESGFSLDLCHSMVYERGLLPSVSLSTPFVKFRFLMQFVLLWLRTPLEISLASA